MRTIGEEGSKTSRSLYLSKKTIWLSAVFSLRSLKINLSFSWLKRQFRFLSTLSWCSAASLFGMKRKLPSEMLGWATLSKPIVLFSLIRVFFPNDGIASYKIGSGWNLNKSGSSTLIVSYFWSSEMLEIASSRVMFAYVSCGSNARRILMNYGFCSFKK